MMRHIYWGLVFGILWIAIQGSAACPVADKVAREKGLATAISTYQNCALTQNDDDSQLYLARIYATGQDSVKKSIERALLFYHLSVENGNATAMVELANLLTEMDDDDANREKIITYLDKVKAQSSLMPVNSFNGELLHPYALLLLASESPEAKWFYTTTQKSDPRATQFLKTYTIDAQKKKEVIRAATQWKQRKMLDLAKEVFSITEFNEFYQTLYPKTGLPNAFARSQAVEKLKSRVESRRR